VSILTCTIPGTPQQQGSKRNVGKFSIEANKNLAPWRADAIANLQQAMEAQGIGQFIGPVRVSATFAYGRPAGHYGSGRNASVLKAMAPSWKSTAPDLDKLARALGDALTQAGVVRDDALIVSWNIDKVWAETPWVELAVVPYTTSG
jgi:Holliday junction resolvase RusA-like endonuclease